MKIIQSLVNVAASQWPKFIWSIAHLDWLPRPDRLGYAGPAGRWATAAGCCWWRLRCLQNHAYPLSSSPPLVLPLIKCGLISLCFSDASAFHQIILSSRLSFIKLVIVLLYQSAASDKRTKERTRHSTVNQNQLSLVRERGTNQFISPADAFSCHVFH